MIASGWTFINLETNTSLILLCAAVMRLAMSGSLQLLNMWPVEPTGSLHRGHTVEGYSSGYHLLRSVMLGKVRLRTLCTRRFAESVTLYDRVKSQDRAGLSFRPNNCPWCLSLSIYFSLILFRERSDCAILLTSPSPCRLVI